MARVAIRRSLVAGLIIGLVAGGGASADEELSAPTASPRVRVTAPTVSGKRLTGTLLRMDEKTLTLGAQKGKGVVEVPRSAITRMEVSRRASRKGKGAGIGALVGLAAGVAIGVAAGQDCTRNEWLCFDKPSTVLMSSILTIPAGTLIGFLAAPGERWVPATDRFRLTVAPARAGGVRGAVSVKF